MDCKPESAAVTMLRIECLVFQGIIRSVLMFVFWVVMFPIAPVFYLVEFIRYNTGRMPLWKLILKTPVVLFMGVLAAAMLPFVEAVENIGMTFKIARAEWRNRNISGTPKHPDGTLMNILDSISVQPSKSELMEVLEEYDKPLAEEIHDSTA